MRVLMVLWVCLSCSAFTVQARNIMSEQTEAANARDAYREAILHQQEVQAQIKAQQALIEKEQAKLKQLQADEADSRKKIDAAKALFEQKSKALDDAWQQRQNY